jgi:hypothetical protein
MPGAWQNAPYESADADRGHHGQELEPVVAFVTAETGPLQKHWPGDAHQRAVQKAPATLQRAALAPHSVRPGRQVADPTAHVAQHVAVEVVKEPGAPPARRKTASPPVLSTP